jgi:homoserine dehydrogenase
MKVIKPGVVIVGCGTVGGGTAQILWRDKSLLRERTGVDIELRKVVDLSFDHAKSLGIPEKLLSSNLDEALSDPEVGVVVELVGGMTFAKTVIEKSLRAGKCVVTANKALLAHHGNELLALARENGVAISFEASCAGGIPVIRALYDGLIANRIEALYGIVNGTCNYILTEMIQKGQSYEVALKAAQQLGFAEADPTLDVAGGDSSHKLTILASLAFGRKVDLASIPVSGIDTLSFDDVSYGSKLGYVVKLLAIAQRMKDGISLRVRPSFISKDHPLAWVSGPFNAVSIYGSAVGHTMYYGRGAGASPTGSAVVSDIVGVITGTAGIGFETLGIWPDRQSDAIQLPSEEIRSRYYVRCMVQDKPGVLARVSTIMADRGISIASVLQPEVQERDGKAVPIVITTHLAREGNIHDALREIDAQEFSREPSVWLSIVDEPNEFGGE